MPWHVLPAVLFYDRSHGISNILFFFFSFARFDSPSRRERGYETVVFFLFVPLRSSSFVLLPRLLVRLRQVEWHFIREGGGEREQKNSSVRESAVETSFNVQSVEKERGLVDADRIISTNGIFYGILILFSRSTRYLEANALTLFSTKTKTLLRIQLKWKS